MSIKLLRDYRTENMRVQVLSSTGNTGELCSYIAHVYWGETRIATNTSIYTKQTAARYAISKARQLLMWPRRPYMLL